MIVKKKVDINLAIDDVFQYVLDFSQLYEWDDHVIQGSRLDLGEIRAGSQFIFEYSIGGQTQEIKYILEKIEKNKLLRLKCEALSFSAMDTIKFEKAGNQKTIVYYSADINLNSKLKDFVFRPIMDRIGNGVVSRLKEILEGNESCIPNKKLSLLKIPRNFTKIGWNNRRKNFFSTIRKEKNILITGPTSGIGKAACLNLAGKGCLLILLGRNSNKLNSLKQEILERGYQQSISTYTCDMENLKEVSTTCNLIEADGHKIDVIINNAGALFSEAKSINNIERSTVVNLLSPWVLSCKLLKCLKPNACIINVSSGGMYGAKLKIDQLMNPADTFSGSKAYALAKRAMDIFSSDLNKELSPLGFRVHCMHPGWVDTPGVSNSLPGFHKLTKKWLRSPFQGADTIVWLAMNNPKQGGEFWLDRQAQAKHMTKKTIEDEEARYELRKFLHKYASPEISLEPK